MKVLMCMIISMLIGCGSLDSEKKPTTSSNSIEGTWYLEDEDDCLFVTIFGKSTYHVSYSCALTNGEIGMEYEQGSYNLINDNDYSFSPEEDSCSLDTSSYTKNIKMVDNSITIRDKSKVFILVKLKESSDDDDDNSGWVVNFGCWNGDTFTRN